MPNVALFDSFIFLFDLVYHYICIQSLFIAIAIFIFEFNLCSFLSYMFFFYSIFGHLYTISVPFYRICFVSILYSVICKPNRFLSIVYVLFLFYIRSFVYQIGSFLLYMFYFYSIFDHLYTKSVPFYGICFVSILYSIICIPYRFISIVYVLFLFYIRSFVYHIGSFLSYMFNFYSIFDHLYSISVHFYCICFVSILYSVICIPYRFISIVYV